MKIPTLGAAFVMSTAIQLAAADSPLFPQADLMRIGVYYYPEAWPSNEWARDIANIKKMHLEFVHMGEFAWAFMEPEEGQFDFSWLDRNIELCAQQGLKVVLCTPSPTPPVWLSEEHPEMLMVNAAGRTMRHGTRQQASWSSGVYREYVGKIVEELGKRYGNDPRVWGWQLDNELSHYGNEPSYEEASQKKFRAWLKNKYGTIDKLNAAWGTAFWSQVYQNFDQIRLPNSQELVAQVNEHAELDARRWFADEAADYLRFQANILRKYCGRRQWITSNFMHMFAAVNPVLNGSDFEIITWTHYPAHGNLNEGPLGFRLGGAAAMSFSHDFHRGINGFEGLMELQPGQVNWGDVNPQPYPGAVHLWIMRAFAADAKIVCTYRYREPLVGPEQYHYGLVGTDGVSPTPGGKEYSQAAQEMTLLRKNFNPYAKEPAAYAARRTALLYNVESRWNIDDHKQTVRWDTMEHILKQYRALKRLGCPVDVITEEKDFNQYPFLVVPACQLVDEKLVQRWKDYVEQGGHLVLTCRTGQKDRNGHLWEGPWAAPILDLIGAKIKFYDTLPEPYVGKVQAGQQTYDWATWAEVLEPQSGTTALAHYIDQYYAGGVAAVTRSLGKGTVTYIGVDSQTGELEAQLIRGVFQRAKVPVENFANGFLVDWRDGFWVATNFTEKGQRVPIPKNAKVLIGSADVPTAGVTVWQE
ncbi:MAG TPA: beta-galactosidase [Candidatus Limnocylindrales bacterium]|nr:beta-galactosidase [Candidatus Limnocylindrales bacterium]